MSQGTPIRNPFPGAQPYRPEQRPHFFGREEASKSYGSTMLVHRCVTIYGPSGSGKSSLVQASILPSVEEEGYRVVLVDAWKSDQPPVDWLLAAVHEALQLGPRVEADEGAALADALLRAQRRSERPLFFYLDQIEQILIHWETRDPGRVEAFVRLVHELAERSTQELHLVLGLREDYLGRWRARVRGRAPLIANWLRLGPLTVGEISLAVCKAAATGEPAQAWDEAMVRRLLVQVRAPGEAELPEAEVQAAYAQIVCRDLFERSALGGAAGDTSPDAQTILQRYLAKTLDDLGDLRASAEVLLEDHLVADDGSRTLLTQEEAQLRLTPDELGRILQALEAAAILRAQEHQSSRYYELGHDWLARTIHDGRKERNRRKEDDQRLQERTRDLLLVATVRELLLEGRPDWVPGLLLEARAPETTEGWLAAAIEALGLRFTLATLRHERRLTAAVPSPDGRRIATASYDGTACIWPADGGGAPIVLGEHRDVVEALAWNRDGRLLVTGGRDRTAFVWRIGEAGEATVVARLAGHEDAIVSVAFGPGDEIATASKDWTASLWTLRAGGVEQSVLEGHEGELTSVQFAPHDARVVTASRDKTARVWPGGVVVARHRRDVMRAVWSPDGERIATASADGTALVCSASGEGPRTVLEGHQKGLNAVAFSPDGERVLTGSSDGTARIWSTDGAPRLVLSGHRDAVADVAWRSDGRCVLTASADRTARIWRVDGGGEPIVMRGHGDAVTMAAWTGDGLAVTASVDGTARIWAHVGAAEVLEGERVVDAVASGGAARVAALSSGGLRIWDQDRTARWVELKIPAGERFTGFAMDADGRSIAVASRSMVQVVGPDGEATAPPLRLDGSPGASVSAGPRGVIAVEASSAPPALRVHVLAPGADRWSDPVVLPAGEAPLQRWSARPGATAILALNQAGETYRWDVDRLDQPPQITRCGADPELVLAFAPSGAAWLADAMETAARGAGDAWIHGAAAPVPLVGPGDMLLGGSFSTDGARVVTNYEDGSARVWSTDRTGRPVVLRGHAGAVHSARWTSDGEHVLTVGDDGTVRIWSLSVGSVRERLRELAGIEPMPPEQRRTYLGETAEQARERYEEARAKLSRRASG